MSRPATASTCRDCGTAVLVGLDADTCGIPRTVDRDPVDKLGEALAVISGRLTFDLARTGTGQQTRRRLEQRRARRIAGDRLRLHPVHAEHRCGQPLPAAAPTAATPTTWDDQTEGALW